MASETTVREKPIQFSAEMVRAILAREKLQTRRVVKPQPEGPVVFKGGLDLGGEWLSRWIDEQPSKEFQRAVKCPYEIGMRLWVRETWFCATGEPGPILSHYRATEDCEQFAGLWRSARYMPRWASRLTLEITDVLVQQVRDINWLDACNEGFGPAPGRHHVQSPETIHDRLKCIAAFANLWDKLNSARGFGWESNPYVWVIAFKPLEAPCPTKA